MNKPVLTGVAAAALFAAGLAFYWTGGTPAMKAAQGGATPGGSAMVEVALPETLGAEARLGKRAFDAACAECHGKNAAGRMGKGPPLVHRIYEPSHHGDMSFQLAVMNGVRAHHWRFGNMPPQEGVTGADVKAITTYVRELQRANGIE